MKRIVLQFILAKQSGEPFTTEDADLIAHASSEVSAATLKALQRIYPWLSVRIDTFVKEVP